MSARSTDGLKRESGENPEQTPLLYFPLTMSKLSFKIKATGVIYPGKAGQRGRNSNPPRGISQKTYHDMILDFGFRGIRAETHIVDSPSK